MKHLYRGFLVAPLVPGIMWMLVTVNPFVLLFAAPIGYIGAIFAFPLYLLARHFRLLSLPACMIGGTIAGTFVVVLYTAWDGSFELSHWFANGAILFAGFGFIAGTSFYWLSGLNHYESKV
jgi:phosphoglycerol transferase MdoB-like AlkP superfamily enzyme